MNKFDSLYSKEKMLDGVNTMNNFGLRYTGNKAHKDFVEYLKSEIHDMGLETQSTKYNFERWESKDASITVDGQEIKVASAFPYSGETPIDGITAPLKEVGYFFGHFCAPNQIGVVHIKNLSMLSSKIAFHKRNSYPAGQEIEKSYRGPVAASFVKTVVYDLLKLSKVKALICIWEDMSDEMVDKQYLNFILGYLKVPVLWVNETEGKKLLELTRQKKSATLKLIAEKEANCETESFCTILKGTDTTKEAIIINTHTDGNNCVEENGAISMLALIDYFKNHPTKHTLIFVFTTGHLKLREFSKGHDQATSRWLEDNKDLWKGTNGGYYAYAGVSVEHLGCIEWKDIDGVYQKSNDIDTELVYTGNKKMDEIYYKAIEDRTQIRTITLRGHNTLHFGEGQPLFNRKIPTISLVTAPDYLCAEADDHQMSKFDINLFYEQTTTFVNCIELLDQESSNTLGKAQGYSWGVGKLK